MRGEANGKAVFAAGVFLLFASILVVLWKFTPFYFSVILLSVLFLAIIGFLVYIGIRYK